MLFVFYAFVSLHTKLIYFFKIKEVLLPKCPYFVRAFSGILFSASVCKSVLEGRNEHVTEETYLAIKN